MNTPELREKCAQALLAGADRVTKMSAFVGLDGFVDEIIHVVDKRENADSYTRLPTISRFAARLADAAGKSANIELVNKLTKLGGNGPIMANALASFGLRVTYLGNLGWPTIHPIFEPFARIAEVHSIAEAGHTDALEFDDGKIMMGKHYPLKEINWENIKSRYGRDKFAAKFQSSDLVGFVNWTMLPYMSEIWTSLLKELCPALTGARRKIFFDLADPEKRTKADILHALDLIKSFEQYFDVILGLNEKEALEIAEVLGVKPDSSSQEALSETAAAIVRLVPVSTLVVHPVSYALAADKSGVSVVEGPFVVKPLITTGAGDHFNSGFCLGKLLGLSNTLCVLTGVTTSGHYVRTSHSPSILDLANMLRNWPQKEVPHS
jgi:sugar/nucleoside kinase (ribokinase family)